MDVPEFLVRQFYVAGSLRNLADGSGFELRARNGMGDGTLVGLGRIKVDGQAIAPEAIEAEPSDGSGVVQASDVSRTRPIRIPRGTQVTLRVRGRTLEPGRHVLSVELYEVNLGLLRFTTTDRLA